MRTQWDYTDLAEAYVHRPNYAGGAIDRLLELAGIDGESRVCDVGAGVGHLSIELAQRGLQVVAVEPNDAMRRLGIERTSRFANVRWFEAAAENTQQPEESFELVTFGSSFNVVDQAAALSETARILVPGGWFACMWNHRDLDDPLQAEIEAIIRSQIPGYDYGARRKDQTAVIEESGRFREVHFIQAPVLHRETTATVIDAWKSHATLQRQAGERFEDVTVRIARFLTGLGEAEITVPYTTRVWAAQLRSSL